MNFKFMKLPKDNERIRDAFLLSVQGEREVSLVPCKKVLTYEEHLVRVETVGCVVAVSGKALSLKAYHGDAMRITGRIDMLSIERGV